MAFEALKALGDERYLYLQNQLIRGTPAMQLARVIQGQWGQMHGVAEKTLTQTLTRLKKKLPAEIAGDKPVPEIENGPHKGRINVGSLLSRETKSLDVMTELVGLVELSRRRLERTAKKEESMGGLVINHLTTMIADHKELLIATQKVRFELGLDEFKGPSTGTRMGVSTTVSPDGTTTTKSVLEVVTAVEDVFRKHGIEARDDG